MITLLSVVIGTACIFFSGFITATLLNSLRVNLNHMNDENSQSKKNIFLSNSSVSSSINPKKKQSVMQYITRDSTAKGKRHIFNSIADSFAARNRGNGVVISDQMGFLISSSGDNAEELAAISVLHQQCEQVINRNLTFGKVNQIVFMNSENLFLTVLPLVMDGSTVYVSGLSHGKVDFRPILESTLQELNCSVFQDRSI